MSDLIWLAGGIAAIAAILWLDAMILYGGQMP